MAKIGFLPYRQIQKTCRIFFSKLPKQNKRSHIAVKKVGGCLSHCQKKFTIFLVAGEEQKLDQLASLACKRRKLWASGGVDTIGKAFG